MIDDRRTQLLGVADVLSAHSWSEAAVLSEVQILNSRDLAKAVIAKLKLGTDPSFNPPQPSQSALRERLKTYATYLPYVSAIPSFMELIKPTRNSASNEDANLTDEFLANLSVLPTGRSNVLRVEFDSSSPETAAKVANTTVELYLADQIQRKVEAAQTATRWLEEHVKELRTKTEVARLAKQAYMQQTGMYFNDRNSTLDTQQLSDLVRQLSASIVQENAAEARLYTLTSAKAAGTGNAVADVNISPQVQFLRQTETALQQRIATQKATYGSAHPLVAQAEAQLQDVRRSLVQESARVMQSLAADVAREKANIASLQSAIRSMKADVDQGNEANAKLATLDHDVVASDAIYQMFLDRVKQTNYQQGTQEADSLFISRADPPRTAFFPKSGMLLLLAGFASVVTSTAGALVVDHRKKTFIAVDQVRFELGAEVLGVIPATKRLAPIPDARQLINRTIVGAPFAESIRNLQVRLMVSSLSAGILPRSILFASANPGEGKSTTAIAFAMVAATRRRVLIIDCDTRRPQIHTAFHVQRSPGLTNYLEGASLDEVIQNVDGYSIDVIPSGRPVTHPADLLGTDSMRSLLIALKDKYECIIIDTPPILAVPDAMVIAPLFDRTVLMVQWNKTPQASVERALSMLSAAGANVAGTVLSKVRMDKISLDEQHRNYYDQVQA